jgi:Smg protein
VSLKPKQHCIAGVNLRERVLTIVTIIAQYVMTDREQVSESDIVEELMAEGFDAEEIDAAFRWMEDLSQHPDKQDGKTLQVPTHRVFTIEEIWGMSAEARGFLVRLRTLGILDDDAEEEIIERSLQMAEDEVSLKEIKALTALILFSRTTQNWRREVDCFMDDDWARMFH